MTRQKTPSTKYVGFRLKIEEYERFSAKATEANMTLIEYLREIITNDKSIVVAKQPKASVDKRALLYLFNKTSNNMNQVAHLGNSANKGGVLNQKTFERILAALIVIRDQLKGGLARVD
ncbi:mobilization protein [Plesiomonas shigelloides]|uniref:plasmid mobilization protein n=1 Tax=Plesiomonas shigelloides TaxID=703 RepID=UPI001262A7B2|nr:mobilization protein [Plesiomonas shigelloides]KAB7684430.1 mobilization protein [Plesiomonas shigelloides]